MTEVESAKPEQRTFVGYDFLFVDTRLGIDSYQCKTCGVVIEKASNRGDIAHRCKNEQILLFSETNPASAPLVSFLQVNFTLHKRRLGLKSDQGHYLTNVAAMNAYHDVLEFLKKAPTLPS